MGDSLVYFAMPRVGLVSVSLEFQFYFHFRFSFIHFVQFVVVQTVIPCLALNTLWCQPTPPAQNITQ